MIAADDDFRRLLKCVQNQQRADQQPTKDRSKCNPILTFVLVICEMFWCKNLTRS